MTVARFVVGIDLGTTHTVVAFAALAVGATSSPEVLPIPQLVTETTSAPRPLLPSLLYAPLESEKVEDPWGEPPWVKGELARRRGTEAPGRLVASAKSWLCHAAVDRLAAVLPWGGDESCPKISPLDASAAYLTHVQKAWDAAHPDAPLGTQDVVLTVPASFDEAARELTLAAATKAGLTVRLLEEPQAAFYDYRRRAGDRSLAALVEEHPSALVLVCDVGGGTTDLSLLKVEKGRAPGEVEVTRVAVGRHLLLGGDNMDLALAHECEGHLGDPPLDPGRHGQLVLACRAAKESLLSDGGPPETGVSVAGAGSKLVGGTRTARLSREDVERVVLEPFFPVVARDADPVRARAGLLGFGLPYERDVAITRHVAAFFRRHAEGAVAPRALLLNGGVFHARPVATRLQETLEGWGGGKVTVLPHADPDLAVARGAVAYGLARRGSGPTIAGGSARGYYVEVAGPERSVVCVVPRGTREGVTQSAKGAPLELLVGRAARFDLFASDNATSHRAGDVVPLTLVDLDPLPPVFATFDEEGAAQGSVPVALQGELTAVGTLDLACVETLPAPSEKAPRRFRLAFNLHHRGAPRPSLPPSVPPPSASGHRLDEATHAVERVFGKSVKGVAERESRDLVRELERLLGERSRWDTQTARALFDAVMARSKGRRRSADHERVFWQLAGYCLRPGMGDAGDPPRVASLFRLFDDKLAFASEARGWQQFWFAWRRVAAGLDEPSQTVIRDATDPLLAPPDERGKPRKPGPGWRAEALDALLEMASFLERLPPMRRAELGGWVVDRTWTDRDPRLWTALGRLGARVPSYATVDHVVPPSSVERWLDHLLREKWTELPTAADAALRMARVTGDRARDVPERIRRDVAKRLTSLGISAELSREVLELVTTEEPDDVRRFGEGLPPGLRLVTASRT